MRKRWMFVFVCLGVLLLGHPAGAAKRRDLPSARGGTTDDCGSGGFIGMFLSYYLQASPPERYYSPVVSLTPLSVTDTEGNHYSVHVDAYDMGTVGGCPRSYPDLPPLSEVRTSGTYTLLNVYVLASDGSYTPVSLQSFEVASPLIHPEFYNCLEGIDSGWILCNTAVDGNEGAAVDNAAYALQPTASPGSDGSNTVWSFGVPYDLGNGATTGLTPVPLNSNVQPDSDFPGYINNTAVTGVVGLGSAVLVADGTVQCDKPVDGPCNSLTSTTAFSLTFAFPSQTASVTVSSSNFPALPAKSSAASHDTSSNPIVINGGGYVTALDASANAPLEAEGSPSPNLTFTCEPISSTPVQEYRAVWFEYTAPASTPLFLSTAKSHYDTILSVTPDPTGTLCNDDTDPPTSAEPNGIGLVTSELTFNMTKGTTYQILVTEYPPAPISLGDYTDYSPMLLDTYVAPLSGDSTLYFTLATPRIKAPTSIPNFGTVIVGSPPASLGIEVASNTAYFGFTGVTGITASTSGDFQVFPTACPSPLPDSGSPCILSVSFTPTATGVRNGTLTISSSGTMPAENTPFTIPLSGTGIAPVLTFSPESLTFPEQGVNTSSAAYEVVLANTGTSTLVVTNVAASGDFSQTNDCINDQIAPPGQCIVEVTFKPTAGGLRKGTLTITDNVPGSPQQYQLTGTGLTGPDALRFVPVAPCRIVDTRNAPGPFGGPEMAAKSSREFDIPQSACGIPASAVAYSLNATVVPAASLNYLTLWPSGQDQPNVSTLNSDGRIKANAAITPAGVNGGVSVYVSDATHVILDIDGYFVPSDTALALAFYPLAPCRVTDTRTAAGPLGGPSLAAEGSRAFPVPSSDCNIPSTAQAYSLNVTAVPHTTLNYLTSWPTGQTKPNVSTLNSSTGTVTANAAIVPAGANGDISIYVSDASDVILDINGYFAPATSGGLSLYTVTPCRVMDTRLSSGTFSGEQTIDAEASACAPSSAAQAYVLNATVVPPGPLNYLSLWPSGEAQPNVSTLNADDGAITSNMAIVPTADGSVDAFAYNPTNLILDISSVFAP